MSNILNEIKLLLIHNEITMSELVEQLNEKYDRKEAQSNFHRKLSKETVKYSEIKEIAEYLDYDLVWIPKTVKLDTAQNGIFYSTSPSVIKHKQQGKESTRRMREAMRLLKTNVDNVESDDK